MPLPPPRRPLSRPDADADPPAALLAPEGHRRLPPPPKEGVTGKLILQIIGVIAVMVIGLLFAMMDPDTSPSSTNSIDLIRGYARMNPLPAKAQEIRVYQPDESPDKNLSLHFTARDAEIQNWLDISPGTHGVTPSKLEGSVAEYIIPTDLRDSASRPAKVLWKKTDGRVVISIAPPPSALKKARQ